MIIAPYYIRYALVGIVIVAAVALCFQWYAAPQTFDARSMAAGFVEECSSDPEPDTCYERIVPSLYPEHAFKDIFHVIHEIRRQDPRYQFCHLLAHKLGADAVAEDPARWIDLVPENPSDGICSNGFIHGIIIGRFKSEVLDDTQITKLIPDLARACEPRADWAPSMLDQAMCYHGVGHLLTYITDARLAKAASLCDPVANHGARGDFSRVCLEGVFMQIYQPVEPDDFELIAKLPEAPTPENYRRLCHAQKGADTIGACLREAWPLFREDIMSHAGTERFCSGQPDAMNTQACYDTIVSIVGRGTLGHTNDAQDICAALPDKEQSNCYSRVALAQVEEDRSAGAEAVSFCEKSGEYAEACLDFLASRGGYVFQTKESLAPYCQLFSGTRRDRCMASAY